jgi:hypothetical protein
MMQIKEALTPRQGPTPWLFRKRVVLVIVPVKGDEPALLPTTADNHSTPIAADSWRESKTKRFMDLRVGA